MDKKLYEMIFKRKSFHLFRNIGNEHITDIELKDIEEQFNKFTPLIDDIKVKIKIVKNSTTCKRGQEYCILLCQKVPKGTLLFCILKLKKMVYNKNNLMGLGFIQASIFNF